MYHLSMVLTKGCSARTWDKQGFAEVSHLDHLIEVSGIGPTSRALGLGCGNDKLDFPAACFDVLVSIDTLYFTDLEETPRGMAQILKPGGRMAIFYTDSWKPWAPIENFDRSARLPILTAPSWRSCLTRWAWSTAIGITRLKMLTMPGARKELPIFRHMGQVHSVEQAAQKQGLSIDQVVRSIVFRAGPDHYVMVLVTGTRQISWPLLRKYLNQSRLTLATEEEVLRVTGYQTGAVSPFGLPKPMQILVDQSVLGEEEVSIGAGIRNAAVILKTIDLLSALGQVEMVQLSGEK